jgi:hypothetical protein
MIFRVSLLGIGVLRIDFVEALLVAGFRHVQDAEVVLE